MSRKSEAKAFVTSLASDQKIVEIVKLIHEFHEPSFYHANNAALICSQICDMEGIHSLEKYHIVTAALVHDVGMVAIPQYLLHKSGELTPDEYNIIKTHVQKGADILREEGFPEEVINIVMEHHERNDGSGYPNRLKREQISPGGRMLAVVDSYEAITAKKCYGKQYNPYDAVVIMTGEGNYEFNYIMDIVRTGLKGNLSGIWTKYLLKGDKSKKNDKTFPSLLQNQP